MYVGVYGMFVWSYVWRSGNSLGRGGGGVSSCLVWDRSLVHHCIQRAEYTTNWRVCRSETPRGSLFSTANIFIDQVISQALFYLFYSSNQVSNPQILSHIQPRTAANAARHETVDLLKCSAISLFPFCGFFLYNSTAQFSVRLWRWHGVTMSEGWSLWLGRSVCTCVMSSWLINSPIIRKLPSLSLLIFFVLTLISVTPISFLETS